MSFEVNGHNIFLIVFVCFISSFLLMFLIKKISNYLGILDVPNLKRKIHTTPIPLLGGIGIFLSFLIGYMLFAPKNTLMLSVLISSFLVLLLGIFDDFGKKEQKTIPAKYKFIVHIIIASIIVFYGGLELTNVSIFNLNINFGFLSPFITIFIIVGSINAINFIDGLDGLCAGISSIYFLTIAIIALGLNMLGGLDVILSLIMLGATLGYLFHNFPPATIYQGDTGSTFLGLMIAVIALIGFKTLTLTSLIIPLIVLFIPIIDMIFAILRRKIKGMKITDADANHIHHQLLKMGLAKRKSILVIYGIDLIFSVTSIFYALGYRNEMIVSYVFIIFFVLFLIFKTDILFERKEKKEKK
ncbi:MAG: undecaprenyl/decaprenyl-phosphate alpha-N-acetylglucosaminyl 1-phosphate transferase [Bacilli bacterium]|nr:undecaprenyl/decaprenyl-phosphate alpha-N-acetylglucosaminyl 1-phosphate transferase [Bacilli bacterium]